jgi:hypothetical protein
VEGLLFALDLATMVYLAYWVLVTDRRPDTDVPKGLFRWRRPE